MSAHDSKLPTALACSLAVGALALAASSARSTRATLDELPVLTWRGASLRAAALTVPAQEAEPEPAPPQEEDGAYVLDLERFTFDDYDAPELRGDSTPLAPEAFPPAIRPFDGEAVILTGFAQPLVFEDGHVQRMRLTRFPPGCCFGALPQYDEWVAVDLGEGGATNYDAYAELRVRGRLVVGESFDELGGLESLYRLEQAEVID